jgi:hypothetical protein
VSVTSKSSSSIISEQPQFSFLSEVHHYLLHFRVKQRINSRKANPILPVTHFRHNVSVVYQSRVTSTLGCKSRQEIAMLMKRNMPIG